MTQVKVDIVNNGKGGGGFASQLNKISDLGYLRPFVGRDGVPKVSVYSGAGDRSKEESYIAVNVTSGTLRREEWMALDNAIVPIAQSRLNGINDLRSNGLVYNLGNPMGTTVLESHTSGDAFEAEMSMDGVSRSKGDRQTFGSVYLPIPIIHVDYDLNLRELEASRKLGNSIDTTSAERAARKVAEYLEGLLFLDKKYSFGGGTIYSYTNFEPRNLGTITSWTGSSKTGKEIVQDIIEGKQLAVSKGYYGPYIVYVPNTYEGRLDEDYADNKGTNTIRERILKIANIKDVKVSDQLADDNVLIVQMTPDVVRLVNGMGIQNVEWKSEGNFVTNYKVMTIQVPQIRCDQDGKSGIVHLSVAAE